MKSSQRLILAAAGVAAAIGIAACQSAAPSWTYAPPAPAAHVAAAAAPIARHPAAVASPAAAAAVLGVATAARPAIVHQDITIVTGDMIRKTEYPAYVPSQIVLPAYSTVIVTITNFDDATALPKGAEGYAVASGIVGAVTVQPIDVKNPNGRLGKASAVSRLAPADVSHTFTAPALGINVPIAAHARVSFEIRTGAPGTFSFRCYDPCGDGPAGWGTAMAAPGYMEGTIAVV